MLFMKKYFTHDGISQPGHPLGGKEGLEAGNKYVGGGGLCKYVGGGGGSSGCDDDLAPVGWKRFVALLLQSLVSSAFGMDIRPESFISVRIMINHVTGVVIGETAAAG